MVTASLEAQFAQLGPARVGGAVVVVLRAGRVEVLAALRAEAGALRRAQHLDRQRERVGVVRPRAEVELLVVHIRARELLAAARLMYLADVDARHRRGVLEAAHARPGE